MNKFLVILFHTYMSKLKSKSFIITTIISTIFILGITNIQSIIDMFDSEEEKIVAVYDEQNAAIPMLEQQLAATGDSLKVERVDNTEGIEEKIESGEYEGLLVVSFDEEGLPTGEYKASSITDNETISQLEQALQQIKVGIATSQIGLTQEQIATLYEPIQFDVVALQESAKSEEELNQARGLVYILLFVIYFSVILYASMIATDVAVEKSSRVMEILISSASPIMHMFGKILGIALLSLTQLTFWIVVGYISLSGNLEGMTGGKIGRASCRERV